MPAYFRQYLNLPIIMIIPYFQCNEKCFFGGSLYFLYSNLILSAIKAINSELVGLPFPVLTV